MPGTRKTGRKEVVAILLLVMVALPLTPLVNPCLLQIPPSLERSCYLVRKLQVKKENKKDLEKLGSHVLFLEICEDAEGPSEAADNGIM